MKIWQVLAIWTVATFIFASVIIGSLLCFTGSAVKHIENNGGLKSITRDIWEGKPK
jgi:hypothetical protein